MVTGQGSTPSGIVKLLPNAEKLAVYVSSCGEFTHVFVPLTKCVSSVLTEGCCVHLMAAGAEQVRGFLMDSKEPLRLVGGFEPALYLLPFSRRPV